MRGREIKPSRGLEEQKFYLSFTLFEFVGIISFTMFLFYVVYLLTSFLSLPIEVLIVIYGLLLLLILRVIYVVKYKLRKGAVEDYARFWLRKRRHDVPSDYQREPL